MAVSFSAAEGIEGRQRKLVQIVEKLQQVPSSTVPESNLLTQLVKLFHPSRGLPVTEFRSCCFLLYQIARQIVRSLLREEYEKVESSSVEDTRTPIQRGILQNQQGTYPHTFDQLIVCADCIVNCLTQLALDSEIATTWPVETLLEFHVFAVELLQKQTFQEQDNNKARLRRIRQRTVEGFSRYAANQSTNLLAQRILGHLFLFSGDRKIAQASQSPSSRGVLASSKHDFDFSPAQAPMFTSAHELEEEDPMRLPRLVTDLIFHLPVTVDDVLEAARALLVEELCAIETKNIFAPATASEPLLKNYLALEQADLFGEDLRVDPSTGLFVANLNLNSQELLQQSKQTAVEHKLGQWLRVERTPNNSASDGRAAGNDRAKDHQKEVWYVIDPVQVLTNAKVPGNERKIPPGSGTSNAASRSASTLSSSSSNHDPLGSALHHHLSRMLVEDSANLQKFLVQILRVILLLSDLDMEVRTEFQTEFSPVKRTRSNYNSGSASERQDTSTGTTATDHTATQSQSSQNRQQNSNSPSRKAQLARFATLASQQTKGPTQQKPLMVPSTGTLAEVEEMQKVEEDFDEIANHEAVLYQQRYKVLAICEKFDADIDRVMRDADIQAMYYEEIMLHFLLEVADKLQELSPERIHSAGGGAVRTTTGAVSSSSSSSSLFGVEHELPQPASSPAVLGNAMEVFRHKNLGELQGGKTMNNNHVFLTAADFGNRRASPAFQKRRSNKSSYAKRTQLGTKFVQPKEHALPYAPLLDDYDSGLIQYGGRLEQPFPNLNDRIPSGSTFRNKNFPELTVNTVGGYRNGTVSALVTPSSRKNGNAQMLAGRKQQQSSSQKLTQLKLQAYFANHRGLTSDRAVQDFFHPQKHQRRIAIVFEVFADHLVDLKNRIDARQHVFDEKRQTIVSFSENSNAKSQVFESMEQLLSGEPLFRALSWALDPEFDAEKMQKALLKQSELLLSEKTASTVEAHDCQEKLVHLILHELVPFMREEKLDYDVVDKNSNQAATRGDSSTSFDENALMQDDDEDVVVATAAADDAEAKPGTSPYSFHVPSSSKTVYPSSSSGEETQTTKDTTTEQQSAVHSKSFSSSREPRGPLSYAIPLPVCARELHVEETSSGGGIASWFRGRVGQKPALKPRREAVSEAASADTPSAAANAKTARAAYIVRSSEWRRLLGKGQRSGAAFLTHVLALIMVQKTSFLFLPKQHRRILRFLHSRFLTTFDAEAVLTLKDESIITAHT
ncbi:unnamed protein product [Amoebophrya sp. A120]|nr:unnamed protein product [Amoebophrya sp. A120]|eukprot:GSA120T00020223001.1